MGFSFFQCEFYDNTFKATYLNYVYEKDWLDVIQ